MAQTGGVKAVVMVVLVVAVLAVSASAQDFVAAPAPAPGPDKGAANLQGPLSGAVMFSSFFLSLLLSIINH